MGLSQNSAELDHTKGLLSFGFYCFLFKPVQKERTYKKEPRGNLKKTSIDNGYIPIDIFTTNEMNNDILSVMKTIKHKI